MAYSYEKYCTSCGSAIDNNAVFCPKCGKKQTEQRNNFNSPSTQKDRVGDVNTDWLITIILAVIVGYLGIHRFYNGKIGTGILMLITVGGFGIWTIVDIVLIALGRFTDKNGNYITTH